MPKDTSAFELTVAQRHGHDTLGQWLYGELRRAILEGRLRPGTRLPATRDFARQYGVSRGTAVSVFERLQADGYLVCRTGAGTWVSTHLRPATSHAKPRLGTLPRVRPEPMAGLFADRPARPFRVQGPALDQFPFPVWRRLANRRLRSLSSWLDGGEDGRGYGPLREAVAGYLASSRGVRCAADQIVMVSGVQQALDLLCRLLFKAGDAVWMEDPGYFGAILALRHAGVKIIPAPIDEQGLSVAAARRRAPHARGAYLTPAHQFPLGMTMSIERRLEILQWAGEAGAFLIEDDYDSEFRFEGRPTPALQGFDQGGRVVLIGTFNKLLFPSVRCGYVVLPEALVDRFLAFRYGTDLHSTSLDQAVLCDFMVEGHLGRHIRRMRELYAGRLSALIEGGRRYTEGLLEISSIRAGLYTAAFLRNGSTSREAEEAAAAHGVESMGLHRLTLAAPDPRGLVLGFGGFDEAKLHAGLARLAAALESRTGANPPLPWLHPRRGKPLPG